MVWCKKLTVDITDSNCHLYILSVHGNMVWIWCTNNVNKIHNIWNCFALFCCGFGDVISYYWQIRQFVSDFGLHMYCLEPILTAMLHEKHRQSGLCFQLEKNISSLEKFNSSSRSTNFHEKLYCILSKLHCH